MKDADFLRKKVDILENDISKLVETFINDVGICDLTINPKIQFATQNNGVKRILSTRVQVFITI